VPGQDSYKGIVGMVCV